MNNDENAYEKRKVASEEIIPFIEQLKTEERKILVEPEIYHNLSEFRPGDIVYAFETEDCFPALFIIPEFHNSEDFNLDCDWFVGNGSGEWQRVPPERYFHEEGMIYRYATEEEKQMFNK